MSNAASDTFTSTPSTPRPFNTGSAVSSSGYVDARAIPKAFPWETEEDEVVLFADRAYKQFDQIFISYGPRPNSDLLLLYGFALDRNPFNSVDLVVGANADQDPLFDQKRAFAASGGQGCGEEPRFPCMRIATLMNWCSF